MTHPFTFENATPDEVRRLEALLARCDYPWDRIRAGLEKRSGKTTVPVRYRDIPGEQIGLYYFDQRIELGDGFRAAHDAGGAVLLAETAHLVDDVVLKNEERAWIAEACRRDGEIGSWWDRDWSRTVAESFMPLFTMAYSDVPVGFDPFYFRPANPIEAARSFRRLHTPDFGAAEWLRDPEPPPGEPPQPHDHDHPPQDPRDEQVEDVMVPEDGQNEDARDHDDAPRRRPRVRQQRWRRIQRRQRRRRRGRR